MAQFMFNEAKLDLLVNGLYPTGAEVYQLMLLDAALGYSPNAAHSVVANVAADELVTTGYARETLTGLSFHLVGNKAGMHADMVTFSGLGVAPPASSPTVQAGIILRWVDGTAANDRLVVYLDDLTAVTIGQDLIVTWDSLGVIYF